MPNERVCLNQLETGAAEDMWSTQPVEPVRECLKLNPSSQAELIAQHFVLHLCFWPSGSNVNSILILTCARHLP